MSGMRMSRKATSVAPRVRIASASLPVAASLT